MYIDIITLVQSNSVRCSREGTRPPLYWSLRTLVMRVLYLAIMAVQVFTWVGGENLYDLSQMSIF